MTVDNISTVHLINPECGHYAKILARGRDSIDRVGGRGPYIKDRVFIYSVVAKRTRLMRGSLYSIFGQHAARFSTKHTETMER